MAKRKQDIDTEQEVTLARIDERLKAIIDSNDLIYSEVKKNNGRVTNLEHWRSRMKGVWIAVVIGGSVIGALAGILVTYLIPK